MQGGAAASTTARRLSATAHLAAPPGWSPQVTCLRCPCLCTPARSCADSSACDGQPQVTSASPSLLVLRYSALLEALDDRRVWYSPLFSHFSPSFSPHHSAMTLKAEPCLTQAPAPVGPAARTSVSREERPCALGQEARFRAAPPDPHTRTPPASASAFGKRPENAYSAGRAGTCVDELSTVPDAQQALREG